MKKLVLLVALLLGVVTAQSQINKGNVLVGGDIMNFNVQFDSKTELDITPKAAWFIKDGLAVGAYAHFGIEHPHGADGNIFSYGIGPFARYYVVSDKLPKIGKAKFFLEGNAGFEGIDNTISKSNTNGLGFGAGPGVSYFVSPSIALEALLKYNGNVGFGSETYTSGLSFGIGVQVFLPSKKIKSEIKEIQGTFK